MTPDTELRTQFANRISMAYREHARTTPRAPSTACTAIYWVARLYPWATTLDVTAALTELDPKLARYYWHWRFQQIVSRA